MIISFSEAFVIVLVIAWTFFGGLMWLLLCTDNALPTNRRKKITIAVLAGPAVWILYYPVRAMQMIYTDLKIWSRQQ
jgi:hypothetical protein